MSSVSVVIPCYRYGHFLQDAVRSVLDEQPGVDVRVLIIDDASPDDSGGGRARKIAARDPADRRRRRTKRTRATSRPTTRACSSGRTATTALLMSADDRRDAGGAGDARGTARRAPRGGLRLRAPAAWSDGDRCRPRAPRSGVRPSGPGRGGWSSGSGRAENPITSPEIIVRTSLQQRVGGYDPGLPRAARHGDVHAAGGARRRRLHPGGGPGLLPGATART